MLRTNIFLAAASLRAAALTTIFAVTAASAAQAAVTVRPLSTVVSAKTAPVTFTRIDDSTKDPTFNQLLGINNEGVISGYFGSGAMGHPNQGYTIAPPYVNFVSDNVPGSMQTQATGINDQGLTSGFWAPTNTGTDANFGFIRVPDQHGKFQFVSVNDSLVASTPSVNQLLGINDSNIAVGFYNDANNNSHGYAYNANNARLLPVNIPGAVSDAVTGVSNNNIICGFFTKTDAKTDGFLRALSGGTPIEFHVPGFTTTQFLGVNASGIAVGFFIGSDKFPHGVVYNASNGKWMELDDKYGAQGTTLNGINDKNQIVGFYVDAAGNTHGVLINNAVK